MSSIVGQNRVFLPPFSQMSTDQNKFTVMLSLGLGLGLGLRPENAGLGLDLDVI